MDHTPEDRIAKRGKGTAYEKMMGDDDRERSHNRKAQEQRKKAIEQQREQKQKRREHGEASILLGRRG